MLLEMKNGKPVSLAMGKCVKRKDVEYGTEEQARAYAIEKGFLENAVYMDNPETGVMEMVAIDANNIIDDEQKTIDKFQQKTKKKSK